MQPSREPSSYSDFVATSTGDWPFPQCLRHFVYIRPRGLAFPTILR